MSIRYGFNNSRIAIVAFIATMCLVFSMIATADMNGADSTANAEQFPAMAAGYQLGYGGG